MNCPRDGRYKLDSLKLKKQQNNGKRRYLKNNLATFKQCKLINKFAVPFWFLLTDMKIVC